VDTKYARKCSTRGYCLHSRPSCPRSLRIAPLNKKLSLIPTTDLVNTRPTTIKPKICPRKRYPSRIRICRDCDHDLLVLIVRTTEVVLVTTVRAHMTRRRETSNKALNAVNQVNLIPFLMAFLGSRAKLPIATVNAAGAALCSFVVVY